MTDPNETTKPDTNATPLHYAAVHPLARRMRLQLAALLKEWPLEHLDLFVYELEGFWADHADDPARIRLLDEFDYLYPIPEPAQSEAK